jgi:hypothetical protein
LARVIADVVIGAVRVFLSFGPLPVIGLAVVAVVLAVARILRVLEAETRRRPLFWLALWWWSRRRR